jgi:hypothetical protein
MLSHHNGTTGSERKFDLYGEAQDRQSDRAARAERISRFGEPLSAAWQVEADRLSGITDAARIEKEALGAMCFSLLRCRERGTEQARPDVVLAVQPLVEKYQDAHKLAVEKFDVANRELVAFIMGVNS